MRSLITALSLLLCNTCSSEFNVKHSSEIAYGFPECSLITVTSNKNPNQFASVSDLQLNFQQHSFKKPPPKPHYLLGLTSMGHLDGGKDLRKHTPYCRVVITFIPHESKFNGTKFLAVLTPREFPASLKDVDHYIFLTDLIENKRNIRSILLSEISNELRFKIVIPPQLSPKQIKFAAFTFCLYCDSTLGNAKGENAIISIVEENSGASIDSSILFPDFASNLHQHQLKVVGPTKYVSLYEMEKIKGTDRYEHKRGLFKEFFFIMQGKLNFSYHLKPCSGFGDKIPEGNTGVQFPNGTWAGCVADIYYRWADLSLGGSPAGDRLHYVDFSTNMRYDYVQFFTHGPRTVYPWTIAFVCFDIYGWTCVILSCVIGAVVLYKTESFMEDPTPKFSSIFFYLSAYLVGQDLSVEPRSISSKVTYIYWLFYGIVVGAAYACSLQSLIVSPGLSMVPTNMHELAIAMPGWETGVPLSFRNGLAETIFRNAKNQDMKQLYKSTQEDKDAVECLKRAATQDYACFHWQIMAEFYMGTIFIDRAGNHPFLYAKDYILFSGPTWMTRKKEVWRHVFNDFFGRQFSMGLVYETSARDRREVRMQLIEDVKAGKRKPLHSYTLDDDGPKPFVFENVQACFIVLLIGLAVSLFAFVREVAPKSCKCNKKIDKTVKIEVKIAKTEEENYNDVM